jgi:protein gp37
MPKKSNIRWTDATWNPTTGCTRYSEGCDNCYAFQLHDQRHVAWKRGRKPRAAKQYHEPFSKVQLLRPPDWPKRLGEPLTWRQPCLVFVDSMADLFHKDVPAEFIDRVFGVMALAPQHTFQLLTKRPKEMRD